MKIANKSTSGIKNMGNITETMTKIDMTRKIF